MLRVGDRAPEFALPAHDGRTIALAELRGRKILLWFFPAASTPGCTTEGRGFRDHQSYYDENEIQFLGVSFDTVEANAAFARSNGFKFPLLSDLTRETALAYGACAEPRAASAERISYLIDERGYIARVYAQVDPRDHPARVLADILEV
ncbi:MAG TPA: peroxiredoxin [Candidatus Binataceae bacterium]|nr:peroxiredoxin [Candidatus Binataceae bacterium]